jgi:hypothetical protein
VQRGAARVRLGPVADADHAGRQQVEAVEEALDLSPGARHDRGRRALVDRPPRPGGFLVDVLVGDVRQRQGAAGRHHVPEPGQQRPGIVGVRDEVQDGEQQHRDGLAEVDQLAHRRAGGDAGRVAEIASDGGDALGPVLENGLSVQDDDGVAVNVDDPRVRVGGLGDLVDVGGGGQARADVEELPDTPLRGEEMDDPAEEGPVHPGRPRTARDNRQDLRGGGTIGVEVVLPAENIVIDPGHVRHRDVQPASGQPVLLLRIVHELAPSGLMSIAAAPFVQGVHTRIMAHPEGALRREPPCRVRPAVGAMPDGGTARGNVCRVARRRSGPDLEGVDLEVGPASLGQLERV